MRNRAERLAYVGGVGNISMCGEENCSKSCGVRSVTKLAFGRRRSTGQYCQLRGGRFEEPCLDLLSFAQVVKEVVVVRLIHDRLQPFGKLLSGWELVRIKGRALRRSILLLSLLRLGFFGLSPPRHGELMMAEIPQTTEERGN